jgi:hypothetical protein
MYQEARQPFTGPVQHLYQLDCESGVRKGRLRGMEKMLRYDMMLEVDGVLRSQDVRVDLDREVQPGETINMHERDWLVNQGHSGETKPWSRSSPHRARGVKEAP